MKVLVAEDDRLTREGLCEILEEEGYAVLAAGDGQSAVSTFQLNRPDFVCLDIMMPQKSGYEACRQIRDISPDVPIIFISAKTEERDRLAGFEVGADDFISKPFSVKEVIARVRAVARRCCSETELQGNSFQMDDLCILPAELRATRGESVIDLSPRDVSILTLLHQNPGKALSRNQIFNYAWGEDYFPNSRTLDQHVSQLRKRIELDPKKPTIVQTVHGIGYRWDPQST